MENTKKSQKSGNKLIVIIICVMVFALSAALIKVFVVDKMIYKLDYKDEIIKYSDKYEVDRFLIAAMIHCESSNRQKVRSSKGAVGLMQIMPKTGEWIAPKIGIENFEENMLENPEINIEMGCWYVKYLTDMFDGDITKICAAYNAGQGNVKKWLENSEYCVDGELVKTPFNETNGYIRKVKAAYEKYKTLYGTELGK